MAFPNTPHQLSRIAAKFMLVFLMAPFVISLLEYLWIITGLNLLPKRNRGAALPFAARAR